MLVIGFNSENNFHFSHNLDIDPDEDSPRKIHDLLKKAAGQEMKGKGFTLIVCIDEDCNESVAFKDTEDYDLTDEDECEDDEDLHDEGGRRAVDDEDEDDED